MPFGAQVTGAHHSGAEGSPEHASGHGPLPWSGWGAAVIQCTPLTLLSCGMALDAEAVRGVVIAAGRRGTAQQARTWFGFGFGFGFGLGLGLGLGLG